MSRVDAHTQAEIYLVGAIAYIREAEGCLVNAASRSSDLSEAFESLANLFTLARWQCEAPNEHAINRACQPLRKAQLQREADGKAS